MQDTVCAVALFPGRGNLFAHAQDIPVQPEILRSGRLLFGYMNVEHSDVRACTCTQGVYSCFILRDHRQQHPQSPLYICGHITEDYDQETESIQRYPVPRPCGSRAFTVR